MAFAPAPRLLWITLCLAVVAAVAGPLPGLLPVGWGALGVVVLTAVIDLFRGLREVDHAGLSAPPVLRFAKDRAGGISVTFSRPARRVRQVRLGLGLPAGFESAQEELQVDLPEGEPKVRIEWRTTPRVRGRFQRVLAGLEWSSRLGLWNLRRRTLLPCELRVYPNLLAEGAATAALFLSRGQLGARLQRTVGRGREFEKLREYLPGDGFDEIHWKATAKRGHPVTKVFQAERTQEIYVVIDSSRLSARRVLRHGREETTLERYLNAALVLLLAAERNGDRFGLITYDAQVRTFLKAGRGDAHYAACREAVHALQPSPGTPDMAEIVRHLRTGVRRRALLVFLTDLTDPVLAEDFARHARPLAAQHLVLVNQLRAPELAPLFASEVADEAELHGRLAGHVRWSEAQSLVRTLKAVGVTLALLDDEVLATEMVAQYLAVKRRQLL